MITLFKYFKYLLFTDEEQERQITSDEVRDIIIKLINKRIDNHLMIDDDEVRKIAIEAIDEIEKHVQPLSVILSMEKMIRIILYGSVKTKLSPNYEFMVKNMSVKDAFINCINNISAIFRRFNGTKPYFFIGTTQFPAITLLDHSKKDNKSIMYVLSKIEKYDDSISMYSLIINRLCTNEYLLNKCFDDDGNYIFDARYNGTPEHKCGSHFIYIIF